MTYEEQLTNIYRVTYYHEKGYFKSKRDLKAFILYLKEKYKDKEFNAHLFYNFGEDEIGYPNLKIETLIIASKYGDYKWNNWSWNDLKRLLNWR